MSKKVLIAGIGKSGIAAANLALAMSWEVILYDGNTELDESFINESFREGENARIILGSLQKNDLAGVELCIISPGISLETPFVQLVKDGQIPIWSEIQLAYEYTKGKLAAITGTNGKTTTTAMTGEILKSYFNEVFVVGNIGIPYTETALRTTEASVTVAEVSSFQLETITDFKPEVSAILNITPDHLNRHKTMDCYIEVKERIAENQTEEDVCVLNYDDPVLRGFGEKIKAKVVFFSSQEELEEGYFLSGDMIVGKFHGETTEIVNIHEIQLLGRHNYENVMAATAISAEMGVPLASIQSAIKSFKAVEHRIEFVAERYGIKYYNDSKGTNPDAAIQAIRAMPGSTLLIAGGYDKDSSYDEWIQAFDGKVKYLVLIGQTRDKIAACAKKYGFTEVMYAEDLAEAVKVCASYADQGDYVLLSPACASWGMFANYEERGNLFKEYVHDL